MCLGWQLAPLPSDLSWRGLFHQHLAAAATREGPGTRSRYSGIVGSPQV